MSNDKFDDTSRQTNQSKKNLELLILKNKERTNVSEVPEIDSDINCDLDKIFIELNAVPAGDPEAIMKSALSAISSLERKQLVIANLLEALKQGKSYSETLKRYIELGLVSVEIELSPTEDEDQKISHLRKGTGLLESMKSIKKFALALYQIVTNSIKSIPKFVELSPRIGFSGPFPSISFEIEGSGVNLDELFELLTETA